MAIIVNNPSGMAEDSSLGAVLGVLLAVIIIIAFFVFGMPMLQNMQANNPPTQPNSINIQVPAGTTVTPAKPAGN